MSTPPPTPSVHPRPRGVRDMLVWSGVGGRGAGVQGWGGWLSRPPKGGKGLDRILLLLVLVLLLVIVLPIPFITIVHTPMCPPPHPLRAPQATRGEGHASVVQGGVQGCRGAGVQGCRGWLSRPPKGGKGLYRILLVLVLVLVIVFLS